EFLFKTREGYCEHYASAFTVMMRSANIPARVVTGYFGGELNPLGDYLIVRQSDAHAWSEVYLADRGWLRIDPTSVIPPQRIKNTSDIVRIQPRSERAASIIKDSSWLYRSYKTMANVLDSINNRWNQWVIGYNNRKQIALFEAFGVPEISWRGLTAVMFGLLALLVAAFSYTILKHRTRPDPLGRVYARFCVKMKKHGFTKRVNETPHEFSRRIAAEIPRLRPALMKIAASYTALRYGKYYSQARLRALADQIESLKL
ncbi:MAG: transglutaminase domain-containing protein, partial [Thioalkalispiraceae bacterium]